MLPRPSRPDVDRHAQESRIERDPPRLDDHIVVFDERLLGIVADESDLDAPRSHRPEADRDLARAIAGREVLVLHAVRLAELPPVPLPRRSIREHAGPHRAVAHEHDLELGARAALELGRVRTARQVVFPVIHGQAQAAAGTGTEDREAAILLRFDVIDADEIVAVLLAFDDAQLDEADARARQRLPVRVAHVPACERPRGDQLHATEVPHAPGSEVGECDRPALQMRRALAQSQDAAPALRLGRGLVRVALRRLQVAPVDDQRAAAERVGLREVVAGVLLLEVAFRL